MCSIFAVKISNESFYLQQINYSVANTEWRNMAAVWQMVKY